MALVNYTLPFGAVNAPPAWATITPMQPSPHAVNNLYEPNNAHRQDDNYYKNGPYRHHHPPPPSQSSRNYLPPQTAQIQQQAQNSNNRNGYAQSSVGKTRTYGESSYSQQPPMSFSSLSQSTGFYSTQQQQQQSIRENPFQAQKQIQTTKAPPSRSTVSYQTNSNINNSKKYQEQNLNQGSGYPHQPPGFKNIQAGHGTRTQNGIEKVFIVWFNSFRIKMSISKLQLLFLTTMMMRRVARMNTMMIMHQLAKVGIFHE